MERLTFKKRFEYYNPKEETTTILADNYTYIVEPYGDIPINQHYYIVGEAINKLAEYEDAEEQGLLVKVECHCKDCVHWSDCGYSICTEYAKVCKLGGYMVGKNGYCVYAEKKIGE